MKSYFNLIFEKTFRLSRNSRTLPFPEISSTLCLICFLSNLVPNRNPRVPCKSGIIPSIDLTKWADYDQYSPHQYVRSNIFFLPGERRMENQKMDQNTWLLLHNAPEDEEVILSNCHYSSVSCLSNFFSPFLSFPLISLCSNSSTTFPTLTIRSRQSTTIIVFISRKRIFNFSRHRETSPEKGRFHSVIVVIIIYLLIHIPNSLTMDSETSFNRRNLLKHAIFFLPKSFFVEKSSHFCSIIVPSISFIDISIFETFSQRHDTV